MLWKILSIIFCENYFYDLVCLALVQACVGMARSTISKNFKVFIIYYFTGAASTILLDIDKFMILKEAIANTVYYAVAVYIGSVVEHLVVQCLKSCSLW